MLRLLYKVCEGFWGVLGFCGVETGLFLDFFWALGNFGILVLGLEDMLLEAF